MAAPGLRTLSMRMLKDGRVFSAGAGYDYGDGDLTPVAGSGAGASPAKPAFRTRKGGPLDIPPIGSSSHHRNAGPLNSRAKGTSQDLGLSQPRNARR